jgi:hypothetical protein
MIVCTTSYIHMIYEPINYCIYDGKKHPRYTDDSSGLHDSQHL